MVGGGKGVGGGGKFRFNQIGLVTGCLIILTMALVFVRWIRASRSSQLLGIGVLWGGLTLAFEISFGRFVVGGIVGAAGVGL